jgi:hypothetical protein
LIAELRVELGVLAKLVTHYHAACPGPRYVLFSEPVPNFPADTERAKDGARLHGKKKLRAWIDNSPIYGTGGIIHHELRVDGEAECGFALAGRLFAF